MEILERAKELLPDVRNYLNITWMDEAGDEKLTGIIARGIAFVERLSSRELGFEEGTAERELLLEYCCYARSGALGEFADNYRELIINFQHDEAVKEYAIETTGERRGKATRDPDI